MEHAQKKLIPLYLMKNSTFLYGMCQEKDFTQSTNRFLQHYGRLIIGKLTDFQFYNPISKHLVVNSIISLAVPNTLKQILHHS